MAVAFVSAAPSDESIIGDSVHAFHPTDDVGTLSTKTINKAIIIHLYKTVKKVLG